MKNSNLIIRLEEKEDYRNVENLIRNAFWNVYREGCYEHFIIHKLRDDPDFVKELDFVMEKDGFLIGQNMFMKSFIKTNDNKNVPVLTMGPICIIPELQGKGYGRFLLNYSLEKAKKLGFGAVLIEGDIKFYGKSGFDYSYKFAIKDNDFTEENNPFFLCKELISGYLNGIKGIYKTPQGYFVNEDEVWEFDKHFPFKEKLKLANQIF